MGGNSHAFFYVSVMRNSEDAKASGIGYAQAPRELMPNCDESNAS